MCPPSIFDRTNNQTVQDRDMGIPDEYDEEAGHVDWGTTIALHSLAVLPRYQGRGLGRTLLQAYIERVESQGLGAWIALICHDYLIPFYQQNGDFINLGQSDATFAGGDWYDMVRDIGLLLRNPGQIRADVNVDGDF
jgi:GNAT superfamily N-acetyltransferase